MLQNKIQDKKRSVKTGHHDKNKTLKFSMFGYNDHVLNDAFRMTFLFIMTSRVINKSYIKINIDYLSMIR